PAAPGAGALAFLFPPAGVWAHDPRPGRNERSAEPDEAARGVGGVRGEWGSEPPGPLPPPEPPHPTLSGAIGMRAFWELWFAYLFTPLAVFPVTTHQVAFAIDRGFQPFLAASVFGVMGLMSSIGRISFGFAVDRLGGALAATLSYGCTAAGALTLLALEGDPRVGWLVAYALVFGLGFGARGPIITAMASDLFGGPRFGLIYGALSIGNGID